MSEAREDELVLHDFAPERERFRRDALAGLRSEPKTLPCKYLYDEEGSRLFERICELEEYYPTRTELAIVREHGPAMARSLGPHCLLVEYGSGSSAKTRALLDALERPAGYVPVDISREHLLAAAEKVSAAYAELEVLPVCADFTERFPVPAPKRSPARTAVYFPGSTIGNFAPERAAELLAGVAERCGPGGALLIGIDLAKDRATLERAYDDREGVTAAFNRNLLARMNRELDADFDLARFAHRAVYDAGAGRVEMHLESLEAQTVCVGGERVAFREGETVCTEHSHKYTLEGFAALAERAGFRVERVWTDPEGLFSVQYLEAHPSSSTSPTAPT